MAAVVLLLHPGCSAGTPSLLERDHLVGRPMAILRGLSLTYESVLHACSSAALAKVCPALASPLGSRRAASQSQLAEQRLRVKTPERRSLVLILGARCTPGTWPWAAWGWNTGTGCVWLSS